MSGSCAGELLAVGDSPAGLHHCQTSGRHKFSVRWLVRYGGVSMSQMPFVEMPPKGAAFFLPGVRCAAAPERGERKIEGDPE